MSKSVTSIITLSQPPVVPLQNVTFVCTYMYRLIGIHFFGPMKNQNKAGHMKNRTKALHSLFVLFESNLLFVTYRGHISDNSGI